MGKCVVHPIGGGEGQPTAEWVELGSPPSTKNTSGGTTTWKYMPKVKPSFVILSFVENVRFCADGEVVDDIYTTQKTAGELMMLAPTVSDVLLAEGRSSAFYVSHSLKLSMANGALTLTFWSSSYSGFRTSYSKAKHKTIAIFVA